jgi:hypothetical protein
MSNNGEERFTRRGGTLEATARVARGRGRGAAVEEVQRSQALGVRPGNAMVRVGVGITRSENYQSVRADVHVELPSETSPDALRATAVRCKEIGVAYMNELIGELETTLNRRTQPAQAVGTPRYD